MDLDKVFDVFSRRNRKPDPLSYVVPLTSRNKVLLFCQDTFSGKYDQYATNSVEEFWAEVHDALCYRHGRLQLYEKSTPPRDTDTYKNNPDTGGWCDVGSKITVNLPSGNAEFTIIGITSYTDDSGKVFNGLCKAERPIEGGNSVKYFNREGTIDIMKSESLSKSGSAHAESSASVSVTGNK